MIGISVARLAGAVQSAVRSYWYSVEPIENIILLYTRHDAVTSHPAWATGVHTIALMEEFVCVIWVLFIKKFCWLPEAVVYSNLRAPATVADLSPQFKNTRDCPHDTSHAGVSVIWFIESVTHKLPVPVRTKVSSNCSHFMSSILISCIYVHSQTSHADSSWDIQLYEGVSMNREGIIRIG